MITIFSKEIKDLINSTITLINQEKEKLEQILLLLESQEQQLKDLINNTISLINQEKEKLEQVLLLLESQEQQPTEPVEPIEPIEPVEPRIAIFFIICFFPS